MIQDAVFTCAQKLPPASLIYCTEPNKKKQKKIRKRTKNKNHFSVEDTVWLKVFVLSVIFSSMLSRDL